MFFLAGAVVAFTTSASLAFPGSLLEPMWQLNPRARDELMNLGGWAIALMLVVSLACAASGAGLWRGARWGYWLAVVMLAVHLMADAVNTVLGIEPRAVVGLPIVGALLMYLATGHVRRFFANVTGASGSQPTGLS